MAFSSMHHCAISGKCHVFVLKFDAYVALQAREPERRCFLKFDKLIVDDNAYIYNDLEGRVEKLPHKARQDERKWTF